MTPETFEQTFVVGTAGHIDHGKSTLVKALTGIDPDRLAEEKTRGMTIDLGFAWLRSPAGRSISIVDVPGHERFIKNMLAGVGGIDAALLVVAADEGPMPQTDEHLAILDLLEVKAGIIVIAKSDLVDRDWLDLVMEEVRQRVAGTVLRGSPVVPVSAHTGEGLPELLNLLDAVLGSVPATAGGTKPRLPIDRVFTVQGFGTVVTGTLTGGALDTGQTLTVMPRRQQARVRGLQTHARRVERALPGSRVAVNLTGLDVSDLRRGDVLTLPGALVSVKRVDALVRMLSHSPIPLEQNMQVDFFTGAMELPAWLTLLDREQLTPGETGWVQFRFREPLAVLKGDRFIIRRPSPSLTIGGGEIVDAAPARHRRFRQEVLSRLETLASGGPDELILQALEAGPLELRALSARILAGITEGDAMGVLQGLIDDGVVLLIDSTSDAESVRALRSTDLLVSAAQWAVARDRLIANVSAFHQSEPLRKGMPREDLRSRLQIAGPARIFDEVLALASRQGAIVVEGSTVRLPDFQITLDPNRRRLADRYLAALRSAPFAPPSPSEHGLDPGTLGALVDLGEVVKVADGVVYDPAAYARIERGVVDLLDRDGVITIAGYRDHFQSSRKYAQATLEYLDQRRITRRVGDERVRYAGPGASHSAGDGR